MEGDEIFVTLISAVMALLGIKNASVSRMPALALRDVRWVGLNRLATLAAMIWIWVVLLNFADPSVKGIYFWFYLLMGYAVVKGISAGGVIMFGVRFRVDVCERRNPAAAVFYAGFVLATGMIFGGCLWGEADPSSDDEGGWWIPVGFFLAGWIVLLIALGLFFWREPGPTRLRIRRDRNLPAARAAAAYTLASAWILTDAVSGDFYGWKHGLLAVGAVAALLIVHELFAYGQGRISSALGVSGSARAWETSTYAIAAVIFWWLNRVFENWLATMT